MSVVLWVLLIAMAFGSGSWRLVNCSSLQKFLCLDSAGTLHLSASPALSHRYLVGSTRSESNPK